MPFSFFWCRSAPSTLIVKFPPAASRAPAERRVRDAAVITTAAAVAALALTVNVLYTVPVCSL